MKLRRLALLTALSALGASALLGASPAAAATVWNLDIHHNQTNFPPGGEGQLWLDVNNVGSTGSSGTTTLKIELPVGLTRKEVTAVAFDTPASSVSWSCPGSAGDTVITCTTGNSVPRHTLSRKVIVPVNVSPSASGDLIATAKVEGGGAAVSATTSEPIHISAEPAGFGIVSGSFLSDFFTADGVTTARKAGSHPELATFAFDFNSIAEASFPFQKTPDENIRDVRVDLPPGFIGNPSAVGECVEVQFFLGLCPPSSQVGRIDLHLYPFFPGGISVPANTGVFNMVHPRGVITDLAFVIAGNVVHIKVTLDAANNYAVTSFVPNINESIPPYTQKLTLWGIPADPSHDSERCQIFSQFVQGTTGQECKTDHSQEAFLTVPSQCETGNAMRLHHYDSWQKPDLFGPDITYDMPGKMTGCDKPRFEPDVALEPTGKQANSPTGLDVTIKSPQSSNPNTLGTPPIKSTVVTLPEGMTVAPSFADGLAGCSEAQIGLGTNDPVACPDNSRIGEIELATPLLPKRIEGSMYLAKQAENPFGTMLAVYLALHDTEERGILVKVPGRIDLDPKTGRIVTSFDDLPQFPFEELNLKFRSGERAPLVNPPTCGTHTITATMSSYARPNEKVDVSNTYEVTEGPGGSPCANEPTSRPFKPTFGGGTLNPVAGAFSPMALRVSRTDADQELSRVEGITPPGLTASLRGIGRCSEAQIAAAMSRNQPGDGAKEIASPSCPDSAKVGTVDTGAGAGPSPIYVPGNIYLAGPYRGAPISGVAIVPAVAGPVDLGVVAVRVPAYIDPVTAQVSITTDPLPQIVNGVLIRVRDVRVHLDRPNFMLNPTSCDPMNLGGNLYSTVGAISSALNRFQVGDCASLGFKPRLALKLKGGTKRGDHPALKAIVTPRAGDANFASAVVTLPSSAFLDQAHIRTICTRVQYAAKSCPPGAQYGFAKAWTPLLDEPLEGPVYLRSSNHKLPDLVADLHGTVDVDLAGRIDSFKGGIRSSFEAIPDVPVSRFVLDMQGGKKGLVVNSRNLCAKPSRADARFTGQNGTEHDFRPLVKPSCGGKGKGGK